MEQDRGRRRPMPREVRTASLLLLVLGVTVLATAATSFAYRKQASAAFAEQAATARLSSAELDSVLVVALLVMALIAGILLVAGTQIRRGRQWARVLAFVGGGLMILVNGIGALAGGGVLSVVLLAAAVGVVALLMQSAVAPFFAARPPVDQRSSAWPDDRDPR